MEDIRRISLQEVRSRGWVIIFGKVYNLTLVAKKVAGVRHRQAVWLPVLGLQVSGIAMEVSQEG